MKNYKKEDNKSLYSDIGCEGLSHYVWRGPIISLTIIPSQTPMPPKSADYCQNSHFVGLAETKKEARQFLIWYNKTLRASHVRQDDQSLDVIPPPFSQEVNYQ